MIYLGDVRKILSNGSSEAIMRKNNESEMLRI